MRLRAALGLPAAILLAACATLPDPVDGPGQTVEWRALPADDLPEQRVTIWLPPEYYKWPANHRFPVLYMWDGQNLFDPGTTHYGKAWMVQDVLRGMVARGEAEPHIVVGIWSPPGKARYRSYLPQFAADNAGGDVASGIFEMAGGPVLSKRQLDWVAAVLKPGIDRSYRTHTDPRQTTIVGASMGGVMSCYAIVARPDIFGRAGCVSAHFALVDLELAPANKAQIEGLWADYLGANLGEPSGRRVWMDHGTEMLDSYYAPWQQMVAADFKALGWREGEDFTARVYEGAEHDENFWRARMPQMLAWLWRKN